MFKRFVEKQLRYNCQVNLEEGRNEAIKFVVILLQIQSAMYIHSIYIYSHIYSYVYIHTQAYTHIAYTMIM